MRAANLLSVDVRPRRRRPRTIDPRLVGAVATLALVVVLTAVLASSANRSVSRRRTALGGLSAQIAGLPVTPAQQQALGLSAQLAGRLNALSLALSRRVAWDRVLRQLALVLPSDVWLTGLSLTSPLPSTAAAGAAPAPQATGVSINGYAYSQAGVARMLARVAAIPYFTGVQLQTSSTARASGRDAVSFTIAAGVRLRAEAGS